jgi:MerR family transcriptional regulator, light-induced transcriptional regulator
MQEMPLTAYSDDPVYNMKAVTQRTGIPAATLRAWERRYHALAPRRTDGNYRLYSERDVATLRWLKFQLDAGLSISRAVILLERLRDHNGVRPTAAEQIGGGGQPRTDQDQGSATGLSNHTPNVANWDQLIKSLSEALLALDEQWAGLVFAEAHALFSVEDICRLLVTPTLVLIGDEWFKGKVTVVQEHFASSYLMGRLLALFNAQRLGQGPLILVGCAPNEQHELGALMLALMLRRAGHNVRYLGADVPLPDLVKSIQGLRPHAVAISAVLVQTLSRLEELPQLLKAAGLRTHLVYGGHAFVVDEALKARMQVDHICTDLNEGVKVIEDLLIMEPVAFT